MVLDFSGVGGSGNRGLKFVNSLKVLPLSEFEGLEFKVKVW